MSNKKDKRKQRKIDITLAKEKAHQDKLDDLRKALHRIYTLSMDIEEVHITRGARDPEDGDVLIDIAEINYKIMEASNEALRGASRGGAMDPNHVDGEPAPLPLVVSEP